MTGTQIGEAIDAARITAANIEAVLPRFRGVIQQTPPMYSAKKIAGQKLYELARRGETVERAAISVEIKALELISGTAGDFTLRVVCSAGTYIRTLAEDIGRALGVGAHLIALRRTRVGQYKLAQAHTLEALAAMDVWPALLPMNAALDLPNLQITTDERAALGHGKTLARAPLPAEENLAQCIDPTGALIAIVEYLTEKKGWQPRVVFHVQAVE